MDMVATKQASKTYGQAENRGDQREIAYATQREPLASALMAQALPDSWSGAWNIMS
jgi:hypothetical protein